MKVSTSYKTLFDPFSLPYISNDAVLCIPATMVSASPLMMRRPLPASDSRTLLNRALHFANEDLAYFNMHIPSTPFDGTHDGGIPATSTAAALSASTPVVVTLNTQCYTTPQTKTRSARPDLHRLGRLLYNERLILPPTAALPPVPVNLRRAVLKELAAVSHGQLDTLDFSHHSQIAYAVTPHMLTPDVHHEYVQTMRTALGSHGRLSLWGRAPFPAPLSPGSLQLSLIFESDSSGNTSSATSHAHLAGLLTAAIAVAKSPAMATAHLAHPSTRLQASLDHAGRGWQKPSLSISPALFSLLGGDAHHLHLERAKGESEASQGLGGRIQLLHDRLSIDLGAPGSQLSVGASIAIATAVHGYVKGRLAFLKASERGTRLPQALAIALGREFEFPPSDTETHTVKEKEKEKENDDAGTIAWLDEQLTTLQRTRELLSLAESAQEAGLGEDVPSLRLFEGEREWREFVERLEGEYSDYVFHQCATISHMLSSVRQSPETVQGAVQWLGKYAHIAVDAVDWMEPTDLLNAQDDSYSA